MAKHINLLTGIRTTIAQYNDKKPNKAYGHRIAELTFSGEDGEREYTYVDPTNENSKYWTTIIDKFKLHKPCCIGLEYPNGVKWFNKKKGNLNADVNKTEPVITNILDPDTGVNKVPNYDPKASLFDFSGKNN